VSALWGAEVVVVVHLAYLVYAAVGGFLALRWRAWLWPHLVSTAWSVVVTVTVVRCPLTALEKWLLGRAGEPVYDDSFTAHYLRDTLYPAQWETPIWLGMMALAVLSYVLVARSWRRSGPVGTRPSAPAPVGAGA
jgi:Protein of Unknown function (DUF2784)